MSKDLLEEIIHMSVLSADMAVLDAAPDSVRTKADETRVAVAAAIRAAVSNGLLAVTDDAAELLQRGVRITP